MIAPRGERSSTTTGAGSVTRRWAGFGYRARSSSRVGSSGAPARQQAPALLKQTKYVTGLEYVVVSIPRQSRGLYDVSRSKRLVGVADATPWVRFVAPALSYAAEERPHSSLLPACPKKQSMIPCWQILFCWLRPSRPHQRFLRTAVKVKLLLPPRQSRGNSLGY
jgi:hypothetical protein